MNWDWLGGAIAGGASLAGSLISANAASNAASTSAAASDKAAQVQWDMYNQSRQDYAPYMDTGQNALYQLAALNNVEYEGAPGTMEERQQTAMSRLMSDPSFDFRMNQGIQALDRSAAARGRLLSGAQDKALTQYGQDYASTEYNNAYNRLAQIAGIGQSTTNAAATTGSQAAANIGNATMSAGDARASGYTGTANAVNSGINNALYAYGRFGG